MSEKDFINKWTTFLTAEGLKKFPDDFINSFNFDTLEVPRKTLMLGKEFFGGYEVITTDGEAVYQASNLAEAKFIVYSARSRSGKIKLPGDRKLSSSIVQQYENYIDSILSRIDKDYKILFPDQKNFPSLSNEIFKILNLIRY